MWKELRERYENNARALSIIAELESHFQKWNGLPNGFSIGDHDPELTKCILSDIGYSLICSERVTNQQGISSLFLLITEKKISKEMWIKLANQYRANPSINDVIGTLDAIQQNYKFIPPSFYVDTNINLELLHSVLADLGYVIVSTMQCTPNCFILIRISKKFLS